MIIEKVTWDELKEKSVINNFIKELNGTIDEYNSTEEEYKESKDENGNNILNETVEIYLKERLFLIKDRASVFSESYIFNIVSDGFKQSLKSQLDNLQEQVQKKQDFQKKRLETIEVIKNQGSNI